MKISPIRTEDDYHQALKRMSALMRKDDPKSLDELEVLQALAERWEKNHHAISPPTPVEAIRFRMEQGGLKPRDLEPFIGPRSRVSEVLSGRRPLTVDMIRALHEHLAIPLAAMVGKTAPSVDKPRLAKAAANKLATFGVMKRDESLSAFLARAFTNNAIPAMLRKTRTERTNAKTDLNALEAWCGAVLIKANTSEVAKSLPRLAPTAFGRQLAALSVAPDGPSKVKAALATVGVSFVAMEHLPGTYLDGAAMCAPDGTPIIAMTIRHDRIDNFWFTLLHEYGHVCKHLGEDRSVILDDLDVKSSAAFEAEADDYAQSSLIPSEIWTRYASPDLAVEDVARLAADAGVHPAIVAGRWQRENSDYRRFSKLLGRGEVRWQFFGRKS